MVKGPAQSAVLGSAIGTGELQAGPKSKGREGLDMCDDPVLNRMVDRIGFVGKDVLEVGCGDGSFTLSYLTDANYILCVEPNCDKVECLRAEWPSSQDSSVLDVCLEKIEDASLPVGAFDAAVFSHSL